MIYTWLATPDGRAALEQACADDAWRIVREVLDLVLCLLFAAREGAAAYRSIGRMPGWIDLTMHSWPRPPGGVS